MALDLTSDSNLLIGDDEKIAITLGYDSISSLKYGLETVEKGALCYPWDSSEQFTKNKHYLLTLFFRDSSNHEQAVVLELDKAAVPAALALLEARTRKRVEFTNAVACLQQKTADQCGHGQPSELKGLSKVFIETHSEADREILASEITASQSGLTLVGDKAVAEIVLSYTGKLVAETRFGASGASGGMPMTAGRGEAAIVTDGRRRVVIVFEDMRTSRLEKHPATNFARTFVEAYRKAAAVVAH